MTRKTERDEIGADLATVEASSRPFRKVTFWGGVA
jgi:hypothetical protein